MEVGIDIEEIGRVKKAYEKWGEGFLNRVYTEREKSYCFSKKNPYPCLTGRFCSKEAIIKLFGGKISFLDVEVINDKSGKPCVFVKGKMSNIKLSISHTRLYATAVALRNE